MYVDVKKFGEKIRELKITSNQFYLLYLIYKGYWKDIREYNNVMKTANNKQFTNHDFQVLEDRGLIFAMRTEGEKDSRGVDYYVPSNIFPTDKVRNEILIGSVSAYEELKNTFPARVELKDGRYIRGWTGDDNELYKLYESEISNDRAKHERILERLRIQISQKFLSQGLEKWLEDRSWETDPELEKYLKSKKDGNSGYGMEVEW